MIIYGRKYYPRGNSPPLSLPFVKSAIIEVSIC